MIRADRNKNKIIYAFFVSTSLKVFPYRPIETL
jgi:hypothetical protein